MRTATVLIFLPLTLALAPRAGAEPAEELDRYLFPPELLMQHQEDIGLTERQREQVKGFVHETHARLLDVQWDMEAASARLTELVRAPDVDRQAALAQAKRVLDLEREVKLAQLELLIQIKTVLTPDQQVMLQGVRKKAGKQKRFAREVKRQQKLETEGAR